MKYFGQTFEYLKKNCWLPLAIMLVPCIAAGFLSTPYWEVSFVTGFDYKPYRSASETFGIMFGDSWAYVWPVLLIAALQTVAAAVIMSAIDRHFRTGKLSLRSGWRLINYSIFPIALGVIVMSVAAIIFRFLLFGLVSLVQVISTAAGASNGAALAVISAVAVGVFILHVTIITPMLFWAPIMFEYGYKFRDAAAASFKLIAGKHLAAGLLLPMIVCVGVQLLVGFSGVHVAVAIAVNAVVFLFTNVYATVYIMVAFYDICGLDRRDNKPYFIPAVTAPRPDMTTEAQPGSNGTKPQKQAKTKSGKQKQTKEKSRRGNDDVV